MKPNLLIVEEHAAFRYLLTTILGKRYRPSLHRNPYNVVQELKQTEFQLAVLNIEDINTPSYDLLAHLHFSSFYTKLPVIVLSNNPSDELRRACFDLGVEAFFLKPFDPLDLLQTINELLTLNKAKAA